MITIFNREEIVTAHSTDERDKLAERLKLSGVEFKVKTVMKAVTEPDPGKRGGVRSMISYRYRFYVHRGDYDYAKKIAAAASGESG